MPLTFDLHGCTTDSRLLFPSHSIFCHRTFYIHFLNFRSYSQAVEEEDVEGDDEGVSYSFTSLLHFSGPLHMSPVDRAGPVSEISPCL